MSVAASVVLNTARTYLNDDAATNWQDQLLIPKLQQAHRELQQMLRAAGCPVMKTTSADIPVPISTTPTTVTLPTDLVEPIRLWEKVHGAATTTYVQMTEADPLPLVAQATQLVYWQWVDETIAVLGATAEQDVRILYWRALAIPAVNTDLINFINGEMYLSPRTAALAALSAGNADLHTLLSGVATQSIDAVIIANRGRGRPAATTTIRA
jgi:hypothetical protein